MLYLLTAALSLNVGARSGPISMQTKTVTPLPASVAKGGVVTGEALWDLLNHAKENCYAIPAVNVVSSCSISACLAAAKQYGGPMIIQFSRGGGQFVCGKDADNTDDGACIAGTIAVRASERHDRAEDAARRAARATPPWLSRPVPRARRARALPPSPPTARGARPPRARPRPKTPGVDPSRRRAVPARRARSTRARSPSSTACPSSCTPTTACARGCRGSTA